MWGGEKGDSQVGKTPPSSQEEGGGGMSWYDRKTKLDSVLSQYHSLGDPLQLVQVALSPTSSSDLPAELIQVISDSILTKDDFTSLQTLSSSGPFAKVELARPANGMIRKGEAEGGQSHYYVIKSVEKKWAIRMRAQQSPRHELSILRHSLLPTFNAKRPPIPTLISSFLSPTHFYLVLSHEPGGDLWSFLERRNEGIEGDPVGIEESLVKRWMSELVEALEWLHGKGWAHRDIKPHNLLLSASGHLLLTDFGSSAPISASTASIAREYARALVGTSDYVAPEILLHAEKIAEENEEEEEEDSFSGESRSRGYENDERAYGVECDWWSLGVVMYELLFGQAPFFTESIAGTYDRIVNCAETLTFPQKAIVSMSAQSLIKRLLVYADSRISVSDLKKQAWFAGEPWGRLTEATPLYVPPPFLPPSAQPITGYNPNTTVGTDPSIKNNNNGGGAFDFSAFFSSPGLSILRPSPSTGAAKEREEEEFWRDMWVLPERDAFEEVGHKYTNGKGKEEEEEVGAKRTTKVQEVKKRFGPSSAIFQTPIRGPAPNSTSNQSTSMKGEGERSSGRIKRLVNDVEAWREMQEHAWEIGRTAQKKKRGGGGEGTPLSGRSSGPPERNEGGEKEKGNRKRENKLESLEGRQRGVMKDLDGLEEKYESLFKLVAT